jgi:hypothetical protein
MAEELLTTKILESIDDISHLLESSITQLLSLALLGQTLHEIYKLRVVSVGRDHISNKRWHLPKQLYIYIYR